jgi:acetyltransferase
MEERVLDARPNAAIEGFAVQSMVPREGGRELIAGITDDPLFGPVIVFGRGGTAVEVIDDKAIGLPPLDMKLADDLIARTRVARTLGAYQGVPAANREDVARTLVKLAQMAVDLPELQDVDLNPLIADESGVIALDARMRIARPSQGRKRGPNPRLAIKPYPKEWERSLTLNGGWKVDVRPVRPDDAPLYGPFFAAVTHEDLRLRFFAPVKDFSDAFVAKLTHLDYSRAMAFAAIEHDTGQLLGVVRLHADADHREGEYAILLRSDLKGRGLGWALMRLIIEYARQDGLETISGQILRENTTMLSMCEALGFTAHGDPDDPDLKVVTLDLSTHSLSQQTG